MQKLKTIDADTLTATPLPALRFVVDGLLPQGLHILAGTPKIGKSWLALWLCVRVAKGESVWGFSSTQGSVLYLCLEDSYSRIQNRLLDITDSAPANLFFCTMSEKLRSGLEEQIEGFLSAHPNRHQQHQPLRQRLSGPRRAEAVSGQAPHRCPAHSPSAENERQQSDEYDLRYNRDQRRG